MESDFTCTTGLLAHSAQWIAGAAQETLRNRSLEIRAALPDAQVLVEELNNLRGTVFKRATTGTRPASGTTMISC
jgi:hypothetical protein